MATSKEEMVAQFVKALHEENAAVFVGAGLSVGSGYVDWKTLLEPIGKRLGLDVKKETDLITVAQYFFNTHGRQELSQLIKDKFGGEVDPGRGHEILADLPIKTFWTTNYDHLIENALRKAGKTPDIKISAPDFALIVPQRDAVVYKMHGDVDRADSTVLIKDEYEMFHRNYEVFSTALRGDLVSKTFLFIGFSFEDPDLEYILSRIRVLLEKDARQHYCFFRKVKRADFSEGKDGEDQFRYESIKQDLKCKDLAMRYHINSVLVEDYDHIPLVLDEIRHRYKSSTVLISGSAETYSSFPEKVAHDFVHTLSKELAAARFKIASGFGLGIGSDVINGALDYVYSTNARKLDDYLILRPFPQGETDPEKRRAIWTRYRQDMVSAVGCAVFIFGNKRVGNDILSADGVHQEFDLAVAAGVKVIPVGATGHASEELWTRVMDDFGSFYADFPGLRSEFDAIGPGNTNLSEIVRHVMIILETIKNGC